LRERGLDVGTFAVRRSNPADVLGPEARAEAEATRWLVPPRAGAYLVAFLWLFGTRPVLALRTLLGAVLQRGLTAGQRLLWAAYFVEAVQLARWLTRDGFSHLHCHFGNSGSNTAMLAARLARVPFSLTCHGIELNDPARYRLREKVASARFVVCVSQFGKSRLMFECPPEHWPKIHVVRCGLQFGETAEPDGPRGDGREILCVARLSPEKAHLVLLEALDILYKEGVEPKCTLVGDGPMRAEVEAHVRALGLESVVTFAGALEPADVADHYRSAYLVVLASFSEGVPVVLMEAMAHGLPVVVTRVGGVPELVEDGVTGRVVSPGDAEGLAAALRHVLDDPERAAAMGQRGRGVVRDRFNVEVSAGHLQELFTASGPESDT